LEDHSPDPFRHHPQLRDLVGDPETSFFREMDMAALDAQLAELGFDDDWRYPDDVREAKRRATLAGHEGPLWVFAFGSLMWDPSMRFDEVRLATAPGHARHFCLWDDGARGSRERPGLMAALDAAGPDEPGCHGLVFRIPPGEVEAETAILWQREVIAPGYVASFIRVETAAGPLTALAFLADRQAEVVRTDLSAAEQANMIAHAEGVLGTNAAYLENMISHLAALGLEDAAMAALWQRVRTIRQASAAPAGGGDTG
jgi:cation transport protein ChaC